MSAFHAGRRSSVAKKPYNPILGETFQAYYVLPDEKEPCPVSGLYDCSSLFLGVVPYSIYSAPSEENLKVLFAQMWIDTA